MCVVDNNQLSRSTVISRVGGRGGWSCLQSASLLSSCTIVPKLRIPGFHIAHVRCRGFVFPFAKGFSEWQVAWQFCKCVCYTMKPWQRKWTRQQALSQPVSPFFSIHSTFQINNCSFQKKRKRQFTEIGILKAYIATSLNYTLCKQHGCGTWLCPQKWYWQQRTSSHLCIWFPERTDY